MKSSRHQRVKLLTSAIVASGLVAIGAVVAAAVGQQQSINGGSGMTIGGTATTTTAPSVPLTASASPTMKATRPKGF